MRRLQVAGAALLLVALLFAMAGRLAGPRTEQRPAAPAPPAPPAATTAGLSEAPGPPGGTTWTYTGYRERLDAGHGLAAEGPEGIALLRAALEHEWASVRVAAARTLLDSPLADDGDVRRLEDALRDAEWPVRFAAALALAQPEEEHVLGPQGDAAPRARASVPADRVVAALADVPAPTREDALRILAIVRGYRWGGDGTRLFRELPNLSAPVVEVLKELLASGQPDLWEFAAEIVGACGANGRAAVPELVPALSTGSMAKYVAARALARLGSRLDEALPVVAEGCTLSPEDRRPLIPLLRESLLGRGPIAPLAAVREAAGLGPYAGELLEELLLLRAEMPGHVICALGNIGEAAQPALPWLLAEVVADRPFAVEAWEVPGTVCALEPLDYGGWGTVLHAENPGNIALRAAARVASRDPSVVKAALARLDDPDALDRADAVLSLAQAVRAGDVPVEAIARKVAEDPAEPVRRAAAGVLAVIAGEDAIAPLAAILETGDFLGKELSARALGGAGAADALVRALDSESLATRAWAASALCWATFDLALADRAAAPLREALRSDDAALRRLAVYTLGWQEGSEEVLDKAAQDPDETVRATVAALREQEQQWRWRSLVVDDAPPTPVVPEDRIPGLVAALRGESPWTAIDVAIRARSVLAEAVLARIASDDDLDDLERWCAGQAARPRR